MRVVKLICIFLLLIFTSSAQQSNNIISGPMLGQVELRTAKIWVEVKPGTAVELWYWKKGNITAAKKINEHIAEKSWFGPITFDLVGLDMNSTYQYQVYTNNKTNKKPSRADGEFSTKDLWQWRKPVPDFSFLAGSCSYLNEFAYDRPGTPYGKDSSIFTVMAKEKAAFMLWLGDNWYLREPDYMSDWGLWYRASRDRSLPVLHDFWKAMPHYAIWDDHDYGPNNAEKSYALKKTSRKVFMNYWANPSYGELEEGVYTKMSYADVDFFMMDDRYFRSSDAMEVTLEKRMWGPRQLDWLKNALLHSTASFKVIVNGSQILNPVSPHDCLKNYPFEFDELMRFLQREKVNGIFFLSGDRHHSEVIKHERPEAYPLYDITSSPLTARVARATGVEKENPGRIAGTLVEAQNYARITISGQQNERILNLEFLGIKGEKLAGWSIAEKELRLR